MATTEELLTDQQRFAECIMDMSAAFIGNEAANALTHFELEVRLEMLDDYWKSFKTNDVLVQREAKRFAQNEYFKANWFSKIFDKYTAAKAWYLKRMSELNPAPVINTVNNSSQQNLSRVTASISAPLEHIKLPTFSGSQREWESYKEQITALVVNDNGMPLIIKFRRLLSSLSGDALNAIQGIKVVSENFENAWTALCEKYDNKPLRFFLQMQTLEKLPSASKESASHLVTLLNVTDEGVTNLKDLGRPTDQWDDIFIYTITCRMADSTRLDWLKYVDAEKLGDFPKYADLRKFLQQRIRSLELATSRTMADKENSTSSNTKPLGNQKSSKKSTSSAVHVTTTKDAKKTSRPTTCSYCKENHFLAYCEKFNQATMDQRKAHVTNSKLCENCLRTHPLEACNSNRRCFLCSGKHHTKLHESTNVAPSPPLTHTSAPGTINTRQVMTSMVENDFCTSEPLEVQRKAILSTALVTIQGTNGRSIKARVLLDTCAEDSFITEHVAQALGLRKMTTHVSCTGLGGNRSTTAKSRVTAVLTADGDPVFVYQFNAYVLEKVAANSPSQPLSTNTWTHLRDLTLADPSFHRPGRVDAILGSDVVSAVLLESIRKGDLNQPSALQTVFGWVVLGAGEAYTRPLLARSRVLHINTDVSENQRLTAALTKLWKLDEIPKYSSLPPEEEACYQHFRETHYRNEDGRFVVRLPFSETPDLPNSKAIAHSCLKNLLKKFSKDPGMARAYRDFMQEYLDLKHMEVVQNDDGDESKCCYIPHHAIYKRDSDKIRVVFNASQSCSNGRSLNSFLHAGPKLQEDVHTIILRWCFWKIVVTFDIVKMFRQILMHKSDQDWQRILWQNSIDDPLLILRLLTATYGESPAPFQSNASLLQLADDGEKEYPRASKSIRKNRFADDFYVGGDTLEEVRQVRDELLRLLESAGMEVSKWASNRPEITQDIPFTSQEGKITVHQDEVVSTLGLRWIAEDDSFCFKIFKTSDEELVTKRTIMSSVAKLFDPIGFLSPVIISGRILMQKLWLLKLGWDEPVPEDVRTDWLKFKENLPGIESIRVPRWTGTYKNSTWYLHCFCDASERAYAAVLYVVVDTGQGFFTKLLTSKAKVAPLKVVSVPRLELCGALLLSRLTAYVTSIIEKQPKQVFCWSDSKIVLAWLNNHPSNWKTFVANRVSEISTSLPHAIWQHVPTADNPADLASRGVFPAQLQESPIWWSGPEWLSAPSSEWPASAEQVFSTDLEMKRKDLSVLVVQQSAFMDWTRRISSVEKIVRILAFVHRWRLNSKIPKGQRKSSYLTASELKAGHSYLCKAVQRLHFSPEIKALQLGRKLSSVSLIRRLSPYLDERGLMRVGGRLQNAHLTDDEKHPLILPAKDHFVELLIGQTHIDTLHGGTTLVQSILSRKYWLIRGRNQIRQVIRKCVTCSRHIGRTMQQQMGHLPAVRTRPARPFTFTGVDYAGPFWVKFSPGRGQKSVKGYVAIFVCMVVRAVHIEVVSDLTSAAFLAAFKRFTARRGLPQKMYSDNGANFKGADEDLHQLFQETSEFSQEVAAAIAKDRVEWSYIPPRAPNFGGLWESNVRSFKGHLYKVIGDTKLTFEEFATISASIEACLNSRPLSPMSMDEGDLSALTPGHFLIGAALVSPPEPFTETNEAPTACSRWHLLNLMRNHFWKRWKREFLYQMQQRSKWLYPNYEASVGDLVLFKDNLLPPTKWPLARITGLTYAKDGLTRVAQIKSANGKEYTRILSKLVKLPVNESADTQLAANMPTTAGGEAAVIK